MTDNAADLIIRPARAEDAEEAVPLIYSSGPAVWDLLFGDKSPESSLPYLLEAWRAGGGVAGFRSHWVAEKNGRVLGSISVYDYKEHKRQGDESAKHAIKYFGWRILFKLRFMLRFSKSMMRPPGRGVDYVANLGVAPEARSQGIGATMLSHFLERAVARGKKHYELDVSVENPRGQALYERFGMLVVSENRDPVFEKRGVAATRRMRMVVPESP